MILNCIQECKKQKKYTQLKNLVFPGRIFVHSTKTRSIFQHKYAPIAG